MGSPGGNTVVWLVPWESYLLSSQLMIFMRAYLHYSFFYEYQILHFCANLQKYQTLITAKNTHLKVTHEPPSHVLQHFSMAGATTPVSQAMAALKIWLLFNL